MLSEKLLRELERYVELHSNKLGLAVCQEAIQFHIAESIPQDELEDFVKFKRQPSFNQLLFSYIDKKGARDTDIYKKSGIDRRHFSKIRSNPEYRLGKRTVIALALALQLNKKETEKLLSCAGYSFSDSDTFDLVIQFCLEKKIFDIDKINLALDHFDLKPLGLGGTIE